MTQEANKLKRKQDLKKYLVFALMFAVFVGSLWLIFAPSEKGRKEQEQSVGFNTELPDPRNAGIVGDKKTAYEQDMMRRKQEEKMRTLEELSFGTEKPDSTVRLSGQDEILSLDAGGTKAETASSGRTVYRGSGSFQSSTSAYRDINRTLGNFYEEPKEDPEKEALRKEVEELRNSMVQQHSIQPSYEEQVALLEKSYQLAAQYTSGENSAARETSDKAPGKADGKADIVPIGQVSVPVVSSLSQPMSDERILAGLSESRNRGFATPVGNGGTAEKNIIRICVHGDQTVLNGQSVRLRLLEPMRAGNTLLPRNTLVTGTGRIQGDRLGIGIVSLEYGGLIIPVELTVYDSDGQEGIYIPNSAEVSAAKEVAANLGQNLGTSISITNQSAGDQLLSELGKGAIQGVSQYVSKKLREEKVHLKSGYTLMLSQKKNN